MAADGQENVLAVGVGQGCPQKRANPHKDFNCIKSTRLLQTLLHELLSNDLQFENTMEPLFLKWFCGFRKIPDRQLQIVQSTRSIACFDYSFGPAKGQKTS